MATTYKELKHMTLEKLREMAAGIEHDAVKGYTQMNKDHLAKSICDAMGIDTHEHHHTLIEGKTDIKSQIRQLKKERAGAVQAREKERLETIRHQIKGLKKKLRKAMD